MSLNTVMGYFCDRVIVCCLICILRVSRRNVSLVSGVGVGNWMHSLRPRPSSSLEFIGSFVPSRLWKARLCGCFPTSRLVSIDVRDATLFFHRGSFGLAWDPYMLLHSCCIYFSVTLSLFSNSLLHLFIFLSFSFSHFRSTIFLVLVLVVSVTSVSPPLLGYDGLDLGLGLCPVLWLPIPTPSDHDRAHHNIPDLRSDLSRGSCLSFVVSGTAALGVVVLLALFSHIVLLVAMHSLFVEVAIIGVVADWHAVRLLALVGKNWAGPVCVLFLLMCCLFRSLLLGRNNISKQNQVIPRWQHGQAQG
jgi:hypothetical protein